MRYLCRWLALGICAILALLTIFLVLPGLFQIHPMSVQSGSMEPSYPVGSIIYVRKADESQLNEGKVVTFHLPEEQTFVTHRIVRVDKQERLIYTKGDANELEDSLATSFSDVIGSPLVCIPYLGYVAGYLSSTVGKIGILLSVVMVCILSWMDGALQKHEEEVQRE